ncbi:unnamed protein product [Prorocentrum cordatum]|uniref:Uncharacterized protein n=1 Tax=Prorocentrum cordatum TaxID=2364126 RepID=A0ABN9PB26_9DINO|nr:unnamed protein product [Polarella glacialis]
MDRCALTGCRATGPRVQIAAPIASCSGRRGEHTASGILLERRRNKEEQVRARRSGRRAQHDVAPGACVQGDAPPPSAGMPGKNAHGGRGTCARTGRGLRRACGNHALAIARTSTLGESMHTPQRSQPLGLLEAVVATARRGRSARRGRGSSDGRRALACSSCRRPRSSAPGRGPSARPSRGAISLKSVSPPPRAGGPVHEQKGAQGLLPLGQARPAPFSAACPVGARFWQDDPGRSSMAPAGKLLTPERCRKNGPGRAVA